MPENPVPAPEEAAGFGEQLSGMLNIFIDPAAAVKQVRRKLSWLWPLLIAGAITVTVGFLMIPKIMMTRPMVNRIILGIAAEQLERYMRIGVFLSTLIMAAMLALSAAILLGA